MDTKEIFNRIMANECFSFHFPNGDVKGYFYCNERGDNGGYLMVDMDYGIEIARAKARGEEPKFDMSAYWEMSERFLLKSIEEGKIEVF